MLKPNTKYLTNCGTEFETDDDSKPSFKDLEDDENEGYDLIYFYEQFIDELAQGKYKEVQQKEEIEKKCCYCRYFAAHCTKIDMDILYTEMIGKKIEWCDKFEQKEKVLFRRAIIKTKTDNYIIGLYEVNGQEDKGEYKFVRYLTPEDNQKLLNGEEIEI